MSSKRSVIIVISAIAWLVLAGCSGSNAGDDGAPQIETIEQPTSALAYADVRATNEAKEAEASEANQQATATAKVLPQASISESVQSDSSPVGAEGIGETPSIQPTPEATEAATPILPTRIPFEPGKIMGVPIEAVVLMPEDVVANAIEIYRSGQALGRDSHAFSKLGDSLIANPHFLTGFDGESYDLGDYDFLQPAVDQFSGSFERYGVGIHAGLHSWGIFDPMWADKNWCQPNESMVACEFRLNNPSLLLVLLGSNDSGAPDNFAYQVRKLVEFSIENGVIPVLVTKADRFEGPENTNNLLIKEIAEEYSIPLWDFDLLADQIPNRGLKDDLIHLTPFDAFDYTLPEALATGHGVHNLTALMVLEAIRTQVMGLS